MHKMSTSITGRGQPVIATRLSSGRSDLPPPHSQCPLRRGRPRACPDLGAHKGRPYTRDGGWGGFPVGPASETVSEFGIRSESWHDQDVPGFSSPSPQPSPGGRGRHGEPLYKSPLPLGEGQGEGTSCYGLGKLGNSETVSHTSGSRSDKS